MARGAYIGGSSVIRVGPSGTIWARPVEPVIKIRNVPKKRPLLPRALSKSYIFVVAYAQADGIEPPNAPKPIRKEIEALGGFPGWCEADQERRNWLNVAERRAQLRLRRRLRSDGKPEGEQLMPEPKIGEKLRVRYTDNLMNYVLHVRVTANCAFNEFIGRIDEIFAEGAGEITGGDILKLRGQEKTFRNSDIIA